MASSSSHGGGVDRSGKDVESDNEVPLGSLPSFAPSLTSGGSDDSPAVDTTTAEWALPAAALNAPLLLQPSGDDVDQFTVGCWALDAQEQGRGGTFGILCGNWGQDWKERKLNDHMIYDLKSTPASIVLVQEVTDDLFRHMQASGCDGVPAETCDVPRGGGVQWERRPEATFIGFRGLEKDASLMICARPSLVPGMRMLLFELRHDGLFKPSKKNKTGHKTMAKTRILVVSCKMRFFRFHGGGDELVLMNVHVHRMTAKKEISEGSRAFKALWDDLVRYIVCYGVRVLAGDFNMSLMQVLPELRARGLQAHLAAWYPWKHQHEDLVRIDSSAIILIGPMHAIRTVFDCSVFGHSAPAKPRSWRNATKVIKDERGRDVGEEEIPVEVFCTMGSGFPLHSYRPQNQDFMKMHVQWTFAPAPAPNSSTMVEIVGKVNDKQLFPFEVDVGMGLETWEWPHMPAAKQKLCDYKQFDPHTSFFNRGAHMPTMIYLGTSSDTRRKPDPSKRRYERAVSKGFVRRTSADQQDMPSHGNGEATWHGHWADSSWGWAASQKPNWHGHWADSSWDWASWGSASSWAGSRWQSGDRSSSSGG